MLSGWQIPYMTNDILATCILLLIFKLNVWEFPVFLVIHAVHYDARELAVASGIRSLLFPLNNKAFPSFQRNHHIPSQISATVSWAILYIHILDVCFLLLILLTAKLYTPHQNDNRTRTSEPKGKLSLAWFSSLCLALQWACSFGMQGWGCRGINQEGFNQPVCIGCPKCSGTHKLCRKWEHKDR